MYIVKAARRTRKGSKTTSILQRTKALENKKTLKKKKKGQVLGGFDLSGNWQPEEIMLEEKEERCFCWCILCNESEKS